MATKSGLMLGLGETMDEVLEVAADFRGVGCDMLTLGQYLQPTPNNLPVERYVPPEEFDWIVSSAAKLGFTIVASGPSSGRELPRRRDGGREGHVRL